MILNVNGHTFREDVETWNEFTVRRLYFIDDRPVSHEVFIRLLGIESASDSFRRVDNSSLSNSWENLR